MILDSLVLENIRSYGHEEIVFPRGITLFKGDIGSGKSSILMAIEFALFGFAPKDLQSILAKKAHMGYATLEFTVDDQKYEIRRVVEREKGTVRQDSKSSYIKTNGEKEPLSVTDLKRRVLKILRFNESASARYMSRIYRYAVFTPQEEMKNVLNDTEKRKEMIRKAFKVEDYANAGANSKNLAKKIENQTARFEERSRRIEDMKIQNQASKEQIAVISSEITTIKKELKTMEYIKVESNKKMEQLRKKQREKDMLQNRKIQLEISIKDYQSRFISSKAVIESAKKAIDEGNVKLGRVKNIKKPTEKTPAKIQAEIERIVEVEKRLAVENTRYNVCMERINSIGEMTEKNSAKADENMKTLQAKINQMKTEDDANRKKLGKLKKHEAENEIHSATLRKEIVKFADFGTKCPTCERDITTEEMNVMKKERSAHLDKLNLELRNIRNYITETKEYSSRLVNNIQETEIEISECRQLVSRIKEYEKESKRRDQASINIAKMEAEYKNFKKSSGYADDPIGNLVRLKENLAEYQKAATMTEGLEENLKNYAEITSRHRIETEKLEASIAGSKEEIRENGVKTKSFEGIDSEIESAANQRKNMYQKIKELDQKLGSLEQNLQNEKQKIKENNEKITDAKIWKMQHAKFSEYQEWLGAYFNPAVEKIEKEVMLSIRQNFDDTYRKWYLMLIDDPTKESSIDEDFTPTVTQDGFVQDMTSLSGGEKTSIALAYRLTLNSLMRREAQSLKSNLLILDEPTDGFSKGQLAKMNDVLAELGSKQIILVSHDDELASHADNVFHVTKENGRSMIVQV